MMIRKLALMVILSFSSVIHPEKQVNPAAFPGDYPVLHPKFRQWAAPSAGEKVRFNPPALLWPAAKGKSVTYEVRLSPRKDFTGPGLIRAEGISMAVFNPHMMLSQGYWYWQYRVSSRTMVGGE